MTPEQRARELLRRVEADKELLKKINKDRDRPEEQRRIRELKKQIKNDEQLLTKVEGEHRKKRLRQRIAANKKLLRPEGILLSDYEQRALTLDLVHACWPQGHHPPAALTTLLKVALELTDAHEIGGWMLYFKDEHGHVQDHRGSARNYDQWLAAIGIEAEYITELASRKAKELHPPKQLPAELKQEELANLERELRAKEGGLEKRELTEKDKKRALDELRSKYWAKRWELEGKGLPLTRAEFKEHVKPMSDYQLEREMQKRFGSEAPSRRTLNDWRKDPEYRACADGEPPEDAWQRLDSYEW
jgi:hypothetical protein